MTWWAARRYARLKREEEDDTLRSCTFRPATQALTQRTGMARSRSLGLGCPEVASMRLYQQALEQARSQEAKRLQEQQVCLVHECMDSEELLAVLEWGCHSLEQAKRACQCCTRLCRRHLGFICTAGQHASLSSRLLPLMRAGLCVATAQRRK